MSSYTTIIKYYAFAFITIVAHLKKEENFVIIDSEV